MAIQNASVLHAANPDGISRSLASGWISLRDLARQWPGRRKPLHISVPHRWASAGSAGVVLKTQFLPGVGRATRPEWVDEFVAAVARAKERRPVKRERPGTRKRKARARRSEQTLRKYGLTPDGDA